MRKDAGALTTLPRSIYHLADAVNWPSIQRYGLLSTSALLDLAGVQGSERERIERQQRFQQITLPNGVIIRDQRPMPPSALERCLHDMAPHEWYALLNAKVFFWLDNERLSRMLKANRRSPQMLLTVDTGRLLTAYAEQVSLTPINTGNARRRPATRGRQTFVPYHTWLKSRWASEAAALGTPPRSKSHPPAELTITHAVPDFMEFVIHSELIKL